MIVDPSIKEKEFDAVIERCKGLLNVSYYKYGPANRNFGEGRVDVEKTIDNCLIKFHKTRNTEYLHDIINYCMFGIMFPLPGDYYKHTDSNGSAGVVGTPINMEQK